MTLISKGRLRKLRERKQDSPPTAVNAPAAANAPPATNVHAGGADGGSGTPANDKRTYEVVCDDDPGPWLRAWRFIHSRHTSGIEFAFCVVLALFVVTCLVCIAFWPPVCDIHDLDRLSKLVTIFLSPLLFATALQFLYSTGVKRRGVVAMMRSEIVSIARLFAAANIVGDFIDLYSRICCARDSSKLGFAGEARKESYMTVFDKNIENLGSLHAVLLDHIAAFYSFLKASRDATGALGNWTEAYPTSRKLDDIVDIIYLSFLTMMHGHYAVNRLFETSDKDRQDLVKDVFTGVELQCYLFLLLAVDKSDYRYTTLTLRYGHYADLACKFRYVDLFGTVPLSDDLEKILRAYSDERRNVTGQQLKLQLFPDAP